VVCCILIEPETPSDPAVTIVCDIRYAALSDAKSYFMLGAGCLLTFGIAAILLLRNDSTT
jgi:hypothetical protein